jgi:hypothetical protein
MKDLYFKDVTAQIDANFINQGWITVYKSFKEESVEEGGLYSAIVNIDKVDEALKSYWWEIQGNIRPSINDEKYCSINNFDFEPLVLCREVVGQYDHYRELSEDFRLYHNLYELYTSPNQKNIYI